MEHDMMTALNIYAEGSLINRQHAAVAATYNHEKMHIKTEMTAAVCLPPIQFPPLVSNKQKSENSTEKKYKGQHTFIYLVQ